MTTPEERAAARQTLKEDGPLTFFFGDLKRYWTEQPINALLVFLGWALGTYTLFTLLIALNYDMSYCTSNVAGANGKQLYTYNTFVDHVNTYNRALERSALGLASPPATTTEPFTITCTYDLTRWQHDFTITTFLDEWRIVFLKQ